MLDILFLSAFEMQLSSHIVYSNLQGPQLHRNERDCEKDYPFSIEH